MKKYEVWYRKDRESKPTWIYDEDASPKLYREFFDSQEAAQVVVDQMTKDFGDRGCTYHVEEINDTTNP